MWSVCLFSFVFIHALICLSNGQGWRSIPGTTRTNFRSTNLESLMNRIPINTNHQSRNQQFSNRFVDNRVSNNRYTNEIYPRNNQNSRFNTRSRSNQFTNQFSNQISNQFSNQQNNRFTNNFNRFNAASNRASASRHNHLSASAMRKLLEFINLHRSGVDAQDMNVMKWSNALAREAGGRSETCQLLHRNSTSGESLIVVPQQYTGEKVAEYINKRWIAEKNDFRLGTDCRVTTPNTCAYSQMIWAQSKRMGCASHWCASSQFVVCLFEPAGNGIGRLPYMKGNHCQRCPRGSTRCTNQLCDWGNMNTMFGK